MWMAGAGVKSGISYGETDDFSYNIIKDPVHVHDFHATLLHLMGVDHERLTYKFQGRRFRMFTGNSSRTFWPSIYFPTFSFTRPRSLYDLWGLNVFVS